MEAPKRVELGLPVLALCLDLGVSSATFYQWRAKYGGMGTSMMPGMKELEVEDRRLNKLRIEVLLKADIVAEVIPKSRDAISDM